MKHALSSCLFALLGAMLLTLSAPDSYADNGPSWKPLPLACLPERAAPWNSNEQSEAQQASCHCPPPSMCPSVTFSGTTAPAAILNWPNSDKLPSEFVERCCPPPMCPAGSDYAGQRVPADGNCNRPRCPAGTDLVGQIVPDNGNCNACPGGQHMQTLTTQGTTSTVCTQVGGGRNGYQSCRDVTTPGQTIVACGCPSGTRQVGSVCTRPAPFRTNPGGGGSCFIAGTQITLADGTKKAIETLVAGDVVKGHSGNNKVLRMETPKLAERQLYSINGSKAFVTHEHPFLTLDGFKSIDPDATHEENSGLKVGVLKVGDVLVTDHGKVKIVSIEAHDGDADTTLYNPLLTGDHTYYADGFVVHNKTASDCLRGDSLVTLANGKHVPVTQVKVGDSLSGPDGNAVVTQTNHLSTANTLFYRINDRKIAITGDHPILTNDGWKAADDTGAYSVIKDRLDEGDVIPLANGKTLKVDAITMLKSNGKPQDSVNIGTKDGKSFYVDGIPVKPFNDIMFKY